MREASEKTMMASQTLSLLCVIHSRLFSYLKRGFPLTTQTCMVFLHTKLNIVTAQAVVMGDPPFSFLLISHTRAGTTYRLTLLTVNRCGLKLIHHSLVSITPILCWGAFIGPPHLRFLILLVLLMPP